MSINNLSNDRGGFPLLNTRPSFLRDDGAPTMIKTIERYDADTNQAAGDGAGVRSSSLFGGGAEKIDYKSMAQAMLARLDALRDRVFGDGSDSTDADGATSVQRGGGGAGGGVKHGWWNNGKWYATSNAPTPTTPTAPTSPTSTSTPTTTTTNSTSPPATTTSTTSSTSTSSPTTNAPSTTTTSTTAPPPTIPTTPTTQTPTVISGQTQSGSISLNDGATTIADTYISGSTGIVGDNATNVTALTLNNVTIRSTNYGIYLGSADTVRLSNVDIQTDPNGGDSYSVRGNIRNFVSNDSTFRAGIKAFRLYGVESGSSLRDTYSGDRMMLGGGYANEWGTAAPFWNFTFKDGSIDVNSVELYNNTSNVTFENMDFSGTGHISIQAGAHDIVFKNCTNLPQIRLYGTNGTWTSLPADPSRNIVVM